MKKQQKKHTNVNCRKRICKNSQEKLSKYAERYSGITLISLVITIIILIILAGISISLILGENGLFSKAKEATQKFSDAQKEEEKALAELEMEIKDNENLPEITDETPVGTQVKLPNEWIPTDEAGKISVRAIAVEKEGEKEVVPVPKGFYYVGGTIESGVVISDNLKDQNKYADYQPKEEGEEGIPAGVVYDTNTGIPKTESQLTEDEEKTVIFGNQFVWIPVKAGDYKKEIWTDGNETEYANAEWEQTTPEEELEQIKKYGGFYIGRYEAGTSNITLTANSTKVDFTAAHTVESWIDDKFSIRDELLSNRTISGKITCKAGEIPYYHADYYTASKLCDNMYQTDYVQSGLVTGTMWDTMMKFIANGNNNVVTTQSYWGNFNAANENVKYEVGQGRYAIVQHQGDNSGSNDAFKESDGTFQYGIRTTASTEDVKQKNLYDVAGNLWEWTTEKFEEIEEHYMLRGGTFNSPYVVYPACYRIIRGASESNTSRGFRPALFIV